MAESKACREAAIAAHDTRKQEDATRMNRQHVNQWMKEYSYTEFKCIIKDAYVITLSSVKFSKGMGIF